MNFSFFALYSFLLLSFFLYLKSVPIYVIVHVPYMYDSSSAMIVLSTDCVNVLFFLY